MGLFGRSKHKDEKIEQMKVLLDNFQFADLEGFCVNILREKPAIDREHLSSTEILDFIWNEYHKGKVSFSQLKEFALKNNVVAENFFE
jgi:predicted DNA-binding helix-hairpin-helix protein